MARENQIKIEEELKKGASLSIIDIVNRLIEHAYESRASDIHIEPEEKRVKVRFRIDGILNDAFIFPKDIQSEIITRIKVISGLRTDEHQAAQDGRFRTEIKTGKEGGPVDVRVSIAPTYYGENCVMRLLVASAENYTLETLGFNKSNVEKIERAMKKPYGMILATGPTGSGKTTTLYTILKILNTKEVSIITIEDPIEYAIEGIDQIQANPRTGLTFANGLRSVLRQDPNIIMVGEIRDQETAGIAVNAALTGHLLLSTLHTNDAATSLPRLLDMNIEPFLIASTINVVVGQRLVRKICPKCKAKKELSPAELKILNELIAQFISSEKYKSFSNKTTFYKGTGCDTCSSTGYLGRIGIHEVLEVDEEIRKALMHKADASEIKEIATKKGMTTMIEDGFQKALDGVTTIEEILRVIHE